VVLVNRGWRPNPEDRNRVAVPAPPVGPQQIRGIIGPPPAHGIRLGGAGDVEHLGTGLLRVQLVDTNRLGKLLDLDLLPYTVMLNPSEPDGFLRNWRRPGSTEGRNRSYAVQWFAMAAAVAALFVYYNLKRVV
jgi:surfeit locus 1 family protein